MNSWTTVLFWDHHEKDIMAPTQLIPQNFKYSGTSWACYVDPKGPRSFHRCMTKIDPGSSEIPYNYWQIHQDPIWTKIISGGYLQHLWPIKIYLFHIGRLQLGHIKMDVKSIKKAHWLQNPHQTAGSYNQQFPSLPITKALVEHQTKSTWLQSHILKKNILTTCQQSIVQGVCIVNKPLEVSSWEGQEWFAR